VNNSKGNMMSDSIKGKYDKRFYKRISGFAWRQKQY
jgi:hypothetical protein